MILAFIGGEGGGHEVYQGNCRVNIDLETDNKKLG